MDEPHLLHLCKAPPLHPSTRGIPLPRTSSTSQYGPPWSAPVCLHNDANSFTSCCRVLCHWLGPHTLSNWRLHMLQHLYDSSKYSNRRVDLVCRSYYPGRAVGHEHLAFTPRPSETTQCSCWLPCCSSTDLCSCCILRLHSQDSGQKPILSWSHSPTHVPHSCNTVCYEWSHILTVSS